jgi:hypothetical protein
MILKSLFSFMITTLMFAAPSFADPGSGDPSDSPECKQSLANAHDDLERIVNRQDDNNSTSTASADDKEGGGGNPMMEMVNQIAQGQQKQAELAQKAVDQNRQLDNERFKQLNDINDKIHEFEKGDYKRRMSIQDAGTKLKKEQSTIRISCNKKAEDDYNAEFTRLNGLSATSTYQVSNMSRMSGTDKRMRASLSVYRRRCMSDPTTREQLQNVQDEYDSKMHNFQIAAEEINSDVSYTRGKIGLLEAHMADQKRQLASSLAQQQAALQQQQQMQMMGMAMGMMTASSEGEAEEKDAEEFRSADQTLKQWEDIYKTCRNAIGETAAPKVPTDIYHVFVEVNESCRGDSGLKCVRDSNKESEDPNDRTRR